MSTTTRRLLQYLKPYRPLLGVGALATLVAAVADGYTFALLIPFLRTLFGETALPETGTAVERALDWTVGPFLDGSPSAAVRSVVVVILFVVIIKNVAAYLAAYLSVRVQEGVVRDLRVHLYRHIQEQGLEFFKRMRGGQLVSRMLADADQAKLGVAALMASFLQNVTLLAVYLAILLALSWRLTLLALALTPLLIAVLRPVLARLRARSKVVVEERGDLTSLMAETVAGARLVKAHGAEGYERRRFEAAADRNRAGALDAQRFALLARPLSEVFGAIVVVLVLSVGTQVVMSGSTSLRPETLIAFLAVTLRLMSPVKSLSQLPAMLEHAAAAATRIFEIIDLPRGEVDRVKGQRAEPFRREIVYDDVSFSYDGDARALDHISFGIRPGDVVAIVGPSGAGKSTLVDLLPRFHDPTAGRVTWDGVDLRSLTRRSLRDHIAIVSQETVIFNDSVFQNIAYGREDDVPRAMVERAARLANAYDFIASLPKGFETVLGERGTRLSGGERQRIAIARAILKDAPILVLDEATSALDTESERLVQEALARLFEGRTVLVIAHRLSTIQHASRIVVLDRGRVVEEGPHHELVADNGLYSRLHAMQFGDIMSA